MDKTFDVVASAKIEEFAKGVPSALREDFTQDMWVHLLGIPRDDLAGSGSLNLILFRARNNWLGKQRMREQVALVEPEVLDEMPSPERAPQGFDAEVAVKRFRESLSTVFSEETVEKVITAVEGGTPLAEIARSLGKTPQAFHYYVKRARAA